MGFQLRRLCDYLGGNVVGSRGLSNSGRAAGVAGTEIEVRRHRDRDVPQDKVHEVGVPRWWLEDVGGTGYHFGGRSASATGVQCIRESIQGSKVYSVRGYGHEGRVVPLTIWPIRDLQSEFDDG